MAIKRITPFKEWPKILPVLSDSQRKAREEFMLHWHEVLPKRYGLIERFNHITAFDCPIKKGTKTLEIGSGLGAHIEFEDLSIQEYVANELREEMADRIRAKYPLVTILTGDIQSGLDLPDKSFDRIIAVHVLEHLPNLPVALDEIHRLLKSDGVFQIVIPCEGSPAYTLARNISARRIFEKRFKMSYDFIVESEHVNIASEIIYALNRNFIINKRKFFPLPFIPIQTCNLVIALTCAPKLDRG